MKPTQGIHIPPLSANGCNNAVMKSGTAIGTALLALVLSCAKAEKAPEAALTSAVSWLSLVDQGKYGDSWDAAAGLFKAGTKRDGWEQAVTAARGPLGKLVSRKQKSATLVTSLPGAPDGKYVVIQFDSSFENKKEAAETVTPMQESDGSWRVSGYFIK